MIPQALEDVRAKIDRAVRACGRTPESVQLLAASKTQPIETLRTVLDAGQRLFGENRVQEATARWPALRETYADVRLHLIGPLQTNKVREAWALFDVIQTLDRTDLARTLAAERDRTGLDRPCFVQVNTGQEAQKHGVHPPDLPGFLKQCQGTYGLTICGLMAIPPVNEPPAPHFALLAKLAARHGLRESSMGMSHDFEKAIPLGATIVRVGTALFGTRTA